jgi:hypothetical protein
VASCDYGQGLSECHPTMAVKVPPSLEVGGGVWAGGEVGASGGDGGGGGGVVVVVVVVLLVCVCVCGRAWVCAWVRVCVFWCVVK